MLKGQGMLTPSKIANLALPLKKQNKIKQMEFQSVRDRLVSLQASCGLFLASMLAS